ncbi:MAG: aminotransferase class I/II-fold pyridoxal phosphate-dependent enzyme [Anaerolineales bacterium]
MSGSQAEAEAAVELYQRRRDFLVDGLNALPGVSCQKPQGAFYVFPNIKSVAKISTQVANAILEEAGVAVLPGSSFGRYGEGYLRLSYANSLKNIEIALERMSQVFERWAGG